MFSSNYIFPKCYPRMFPIAGHSFQVRMLKLGVNGVNDHLMGADVSGYPEIRISASKFSDFFGFLAPVASIFKLLCSNLV